MADVTVQEVANVVTPIEGEVIQVDLSHLAKADGFEFSKTLSKHARLEYGRVLAQDFRTLADSSKARTELMLILVAPCLNRAEAKELFDGAEKIVKASRFDNDSQGKMVKGLDNSWRSMKSSILRAFDLGVLPFAGQPISYSAMLVTNKQRGDQKAAAEKAKINADIVKGAQVDEKELGEMAKALHEKCIAWAIKMPVTIKYEFWQKAEAEMIRLDAVYKKQVRVLAGDDVEKAPRKRGKKAEAAQADAEAAIANAPAQVING